jgi:hypothetical protein
MELNTLAFGDRGFTYDGGPRFYDGLRRLCNQSAFFGIPFYRQRT